MRIAMRNQALLALSLLAMVFVSGCIGQPPTPTGKGLAIKSFAPDFSEVRSGERVTLSSLVENLGEADATGVKAQLFGLNFVGEWKIKDTNIEPIRSIGTGSSILRKADTALGIAGENYEFTWNVQSPADMRVDNTYTANMRVYYKYNTYSTSILHFASYDYLRSLTSEQFNKEKSAAGVTSSVYSKAPVSVKLSGGSRPFVVYAESGSSDTFSVQIEINNIDTGNAFNKSAPYPSIASGDLHKVNVTVNSHDLDLDCSNTLDSKSAGWVTLTKGTTKTLFCTATVLRDKIGNSIDYTVNVDLDYGYYVDSATKITVLKKAQ